MVITVKVIMAITMVVTMEIMVNMVATRKQNKQSDLFQKKFKKESSLPPRETGGRVAIFFNCY